MPYIGKSPSFGVRQRYQYTATASQTTFSGTDTGNLTLTYTDNNFVDVFQNGVLLKGGGTDYTATSGTSVVLTTGASVSDVIEIIVYDVFSVGNFFNRTDSDSRYYKHSLGEELILDADADTSITADTDDQIDFKTGGSDRVTIDSSGNFIVGRTSSSTSTVGAELRPNGKVIGVMDGGNATFNRLTSDGDIVKFQKDGTGIGSVGIASSTDDLYIISLASGHKGLRFGNGAIVPVDNSAANSDDNTNLGGGTVRFDNIFATNGTINTSDQNEKQDIASATAKELNVAKKLSSLFKTFRWKSRVAEKGDKARTHSGIIAQDIQSAFSAEGLDASNYGLFTSDTWTNEEGEEQTRLGVRYPELFSFIFSSIEARLTALESK